MPNVTAKIIAKALGISPAAVSFALNGKQGVSEATREIILEKAREMGYVTNQKPTHGKMHGKTICYLIVLGQLTSVLEHSTFSTLVLQGLERTATALGFSTNVRYLNVEQLGDPQVLEYFVNVDGIVLLGTDLNIEDAPLLEPFFQATKHIPIVMTDNDVFVDVADTICNDNSNAAYTAVHHLASRGCETIGYIRSRSRIPSLDGRERGFNKALLELNRKPALVWDIAVESDKAYTDVLKLLEEMPELPDGFFVENDVMAVATIRAMQAKGIKIPEQVSIIGVDDAPVAEMIMPQLSTIRSHATEMGEWAVRLILQRGLDIKMKNYETKPKIQMYVKTRLIDRDSVR